MLDYPATIYCANIKQCQLSEEPVIVSTTQDFKQQPYITLLNNPRCKVTKYQRWVPGLVLKMIQKRPIFFLKVLTLL